MASKDMSTTDTDVAKKDESQVEGKEEKTEAAKVKVGEDEYGQEDLSSLVSLGKAARELESKHGSLEKFASDWGLKANTIGELKKEIEELKKGAVEKKAAEGAELTEEEQIKQALTQADKIGIITKDSIRRYITETLEARDLLDTCKDLEGEVDGKDGRPTFKTEEVLKHMQETGIKSPERAYKDKYEAEIDKWKEEQIGKSKKKGLVTEEASTAGKKEPKPLKITRDTFEDQVKAALRGDI